MKKTLFIISIILGINSFISLTSFASSYVWEDRINGFKFSFPESWQMQTIDVPSTRIRISGPIDSDMATCRVKAKKDGRLKIYPKKLLPLAVNQYLNEKFWMAELGQYEDSALVEYFAPSNLGGRGDATAIKASFIQTGRNNKKFMMYSTMIGSIYADTLYIVSCASKMEEFPKYASIFASIMASVQLDQKYSPFKIGYYRDFLQDPKFILPRYKPGTIDTRK